MDLLLIVLNGMPGAGKTFLATHLSRQLPCRHLSSDGIRFEKLVPVTAAADLFAPDNNRFVFEILYKEAAKALGQHMSVVCDAMNDHPLGWDRYLHIAESGRATPVFIDLLVPDAVLRRRVADRTPGPCHATPVVLNEILKRKERLYPTVAPHVRSVAITIQWLHEFQRLHFTSHHGLAVSSKLEKLLLPILSEAKEGSGDEAR